MMRLRRTLGLALALSALTAPAAAASQDDFAQGVDLYSRGRMEEALAAFQRALAADPTNEEAYELWKATDHQIFLEMLVEGGEFRKIAERFLERSLPARRARRADPEAIGDLVGRLRETTDALERRRIILTLSANHGEFAVPRLLRPLADAGDPDWRITAMHTLTEMGPDVVMPLIASLATEDAYQRANVAATLGYVGDPRAGAWLTRQAQSDPDEKVRAAAAIAADKCGGTGDALGMFLKLGDDYHHRRDNVLRSFDYSDVIWSWNGSTVVGTPCPRVVYNNELAKGAYYAALEVDPASLDAQAGIARESTNIVAKLQAALEGGAEVDDLLTQAESGILAVAAAGLPAVDRALSWAVVTDDAASGVRLIQVLGSMADSATDGLTAALHSDEGALRGEAAVALGRIALAKGAAADAEVVANLGTNASRPVMRVAVVIDGDPARASAVVGALESQGVLVNHRGNGAQGIALLHQIPGVDVILLGSTLPDMTVDQVVSSAQGNPSTAEAPIVLMTTDEGLADAWSDRVAAVSPGANDLSAVDEIFAEGLTGDRARADELAARSGQVLADLAQAGHTTIGVQVLDRLTQPLAGRGDLVTIPAMATLGSAGGPDHVAALAGVVADGARTTAARTAAAEAMGGIFGRHALSADAAASLLEVVHDADSPLPVRAAAAVALGRIQLPDRSGLLRAVRSDVRAPGE